MDYKFSGRSMVKAVALEPVAQPLPSLLSSPPPPWIPSPKLMLTPSPLPRLTIFPSCQKCYSLLLFHTTLPTLSPIPATQPLPFPPKPADRETPPV